MFNFQLLDPRPVGKEANDAIFSGAANGVLGFEVTLPGYAALCELGNIDPQHSEGDVTRAAIEVALTYELPADGATLVTVRADLDSVGAMAVLNLRVKGCDLDRSGRVHDWSDVLDRIARVAEADKFANGGWPGMRPLPTAENPWPESGASASDTRSLAVIAATVADFKVPLADRVATMERWLLNGDEPESYRAQVERERADMIGALESGAIKIEPAADGRIAVVVSNHRAGTMVGYTQAPVVVALSPEFRFQGGDPHAKFTVCQYTGEYADLVAATAELKELEKKAAADPDMKSNWGGSPTIAGSPQGVSSVLSLEQVVEVVSRYLLK